MPAFVRNRHFDILASNPLGRALYSPVYDSPLFERGETANTARFLFLDPGAREFFTDWEHAADEAVAFLRTETGRVQHDEALADLVRELDTRSPGFAARWTRHDVRLHLHGVKRLRHPVIGEIELPYQALALRPTPGCPSTCIPPSRTRRPSGPSTSSPAGR